MVAADRIRTHAFTFLSLSTLIFYFFLLVQPFDVAQRPTKVFEFAVKDFSAYMLPNSKKVNESGKCSQQ